MVLDYSRSFRNAGSLEPLLTSVYSTVPLICYDRIKMASIEVKRISPSCKPRMRVSVSVYEKYANQCLRIYTRRTQRFACLYDTEVRCIPVCVS